MEKYKTIIDALASSACVLYQDVEDHDVEIADAAHEIWERNQHRTLDDVTQKYLLGWTLEYGIKQLLNTNTIWTRFSTQSTYEHRKFDVECILRDRYEQWLPHSVKIDVKSSNKSCDGDYFAFNSYNKFKDEKAFEEQHKRPGANLHFFINESHDTELLLTAASQSYRDGWEVIPKYLIHRNAFTKPFALSQYKTSPFYYLRYDTMIRDGHCIKLG